MAQRLHVVSCVQCKSYQVQIVKKVKKWVCKICNTKQSLLQVFHEGSGNECRAVVQALNASRGQQEEQQNFSAAKVCVPSLLRENEDSFNYFETSGEELYSDAAGSSANNLTLASGVPVVPAKKSKWTKYSDDSKGNEHLFD